MTIYNLNISLGISVTRLVCANNETCDGIDQYTTALFDRVKVKKLTPVVMGRTNAKEINGLPIVKIPSVKWIMLSGFFMGRSICDLELDKKFDLLHATDHWITRLKCVPVVATIHDAVPLSHPHWVRGGRHSIQLKSALWRQSAKWAQHLITDSEFSKSEIVRCFGVSDKKITVVPLGVNPEYFEPLAMAELNAVRIKYALPEKFFVFIGTLQPRKNLERIIKAYRFLPMSFRKTTPLVLIGSRGWGCESLVSWLSSSAMNDYVYWLGPVSELDKRALLQSATALVFPTLLEGFGLPVLEAFASKTPVITSNNSSLLELACDAALIVDPLNIGEITNAMKSIAIEENLCRTLVSRGVERAVSYTWENCARKTESVYAEILRTY